LRFLFVGDLRLLTSDRHQAGEERVGFSPFEFRGNGPVFLGDEFLNLGFALADQPERDRLDAPGAEAPVDRIPEQGADLIANDAVHDAAGFLRLD